MDDAVYRSEIRVTVSVDPALMAVLRLLAGIDRRPAIAALIRLTEGGFMPTTTITVDTANEIATVGFVDDKGDPTSPPAGMTVAWGSDNPSVLTVAADPAIPFQADLTPVSPGTANVTAALTDAAGNSPPLESDGVTPWAAVAPAAVEVDPGAAVGAQITVV